MTVFWPRLDELSASLDGSGIQSAARAIMTTDTFPKGAFETVDVDGSSVQIVGIAKGSGMIAPDMATMLVYIFTDAKCSQNALQNMVSRNSDKTFNCITVDSDTSTSDTLLSRQRVLPASNVEGRSDFEAALHRVMRDLAHQVVKDGEGATKFVEINVTGALNDADAHTHGNVDCKFTFGQNRDRWRRSELGTGCDGRRENQARLRIVMHCRSGLAMCWSQTMAG